MLGTGYLIKKGKRYKKVKKSVHVVVRAWVDPDLSETDVVGIVQDILDDYTDTDIVYDFEVYGTEDEDEQPVSTRRVQ
jgi:hypothetical protein